MKLIHIDTLIGTISSVSGEFPWMSGRIILESSIAPEYHEFFEFMVDEDRAHIDPPLLFGPKLLTEENWFLQKDDCLPVGISIPAVHSDGAIMWRWR